MGRYELEYPKEITNQVKRKNDIATYALRTIHTLVNTAPIVHVSFQPPNSPFPVILPMIGQMGSFERPSSSVEDPLDLYIHGYVSSRIVNLSREKGNEKGLPVCIAATHCDGLVLALSAFSSSYNYRSAVLFGYATIVDDKEEQLYAMELITDSVVPGRWKNTRLPPTNGELQSTGILKVKIASGSAKMREGSCRDDKADLANEHVKGQTWAGVLPVHQVIGDPIAVSYNTAHVPEYIKEYAKDFNDEGREHAYSIAKKP